MPTERATSTPEFERAARAELFRKLYAERPEEIKNRYPNRVNGEIHAKEIIMGVGVTIEEGVVITGKGGEASRIVLGDFTYIGRSTRIMVPEFWMGDYTKMNEHTFAHGTNPMQIGRNCWFGGYVTLDSIGGLDIDDGVGIGAGSQVWTHIQFGDIVEGSQFHSSQYMLIGKDAWFVGHCLVSPVIVGEKSMAMLGSVVTRNMEPNHIYAGVPAKDISDKMGFQFETRSVDKKASKLLELISEFEKSHPELAGQIVVVKDPSLIRDDGCTYFDVSRREYTKRFNQAEVEFLKKNIPLIKFNPAGEHSFVVPQQ